MWRRKSHRAFVSNNEDEAGRRRAQEQKQQRQQQQQLLTKSPPDELSLNQAGQPAEPCSHCSKQQNVEIADRKTQDQRPHDRQSLPPNPINQPFSMQEPQPPSTQAGISPSDLASVYFISPILSPSRCT